jgi:hypothetical protein
VIPAGRVTSLFADAALIPNVADAAVAAAAAMPRASRRFVLLVMVIVLSDFGRRVGVSY